MSLQSHLMIQQTVIKPIGYHRPLSTYFRAFKKAGFNILDFDEPEPVTSGVLMDKSKEMDSRLLPLVASFLLTKSK